MEDFAKAITLPIYVFDGRIFEGSFTYNALGLLIFTIIAITLSMLLFDRNKMERNGEILMFGNVEGFFKFGVAFCTMLLAGIIFGELFFAKSIIGIVIGYILGAGIGWFIPSFLINRTKAAS